MNLLDLIGFLNFLFGFFNCKDFLGFELLVWSICSFFLRLLAECEHKARRLPRSYRLRLQGSLNLRFLGFHWFQGQLTCASTCQLIRLLPRVSIRLWVHVDSV